MEKGKKVYRQEEKRPHKDKVIENVRGSRPAQESVYSRETLQKKDITLGDHGGDC
jgi:hypothetical protein